MRLPFFLAALAIAACDGPRSAPDHYAAKTATAEPADERIGLPLYPRSRVIDARLTSGSGPGGAIVRLASEDKPQDAIAFYRSAAQRAGWTIQTDVNVGTSRLLGLSRLAETLTIEATATPPSGARITIIRARRDVQPS